MFVFGGCDFVDVYIFGLFVYFSLFISFSPLSCMKKKSLNDTSE